mmetsp:Transcript_9808/g.36595  ORF Transcript_9808/g.36595 Transcript_9808/m.36595 type:complete len:203 (-) Transcript_9808:689-1297(-)
MRAIILIYPHNNSKRWHLQSTSQALKAQVPLSLRLTCALMIYCLLLHQWRVMQRRNSKWTLATCPIRERKPMEMCRTKGKTRLMVDTSIHQCCDINRSSRRIVLLKMSSRTCHAHPNGCPAPALISLTRSTYLSRRRKSLKCEWRIITSSIHLSNRTPPLVISVSLCALSRSSHTSFPSKSSIFWRSECDCCDNLRISKVRA